MLVAEPTGDPNDEELLKRAKLSSAEVPAELARVKGILASLAGGEVARLFTRTEAELDQDWTSAQQRCGEELADPNLYYQFRQQKPDPDATTAFIEALNALAVVEQAYAQPVFHLAHVDIPPVTSDLSAQQSYLDSAPAGIDARFAWTFDGGRGAGVRVIDVENDWEVDHEDLPDLFYDGRTAFGGFGDKQHGTAVVGIIAAGNNGYGVIGIASEVQLGVVGNIRLGFDFEADAIDEAASHLGAGDVMVLETHAHGPSSGMPCPASEGNCGQWEFICVEFWQGEFDAIRRATARGVIVVEPGGNGGMNLDSPIYSGAFDRSIRDSQAILVGAQMPSGGAESWTNFGSRVDVAGWGNSVTTTGEGNPNDTTFRPGGDDERQWYTNSFSGTSSATPIVAGSVCCLQGIRRAHGLPDFEPVEMRDLLASTGTAQPPGSLPIGPLPNLHAAIDTFGVSPIPVGGSSWPSFGGAILTSPAIASNADGRIEVFALGIDSRIWHLWQTAPSNGWSAWASLGGPSMQGRPAAITNPDGRIEVFARGTDNALWHVWQNGPDAGWSAWASLGGAFASDPGVVLNRDGRAEVFLLDREGTLWHNWREGLGWAIFGWRSLDGSLSGTPCAALDARGRVTVFARSALTGALLFRQQDSPGGSNWLPWGDLGGVVPDRQMVVANADGRLELFIRGTDGQLSHQWQTAPAGPWSGWSPMGGTLAPDTVPGAVLNPVSGRIEVMVPFVDHTAWGIKEIPGAPGWSTWTNHGGSVTDIVIGANADGRLEALARGTDRSLEHIWQLSVDGAWSA